MRLKNLKFNSTKIKWKPVSRIINKRSFGKKFELNDATLDPRLTLKH